MAADDRLIPPSINDQRSQALLEVIERMAEIDLALFELYDIDAVQADVLPHLAEQFNVLGYRGWALAATELEKRRLLKRAIELHRYAGTPWAVKEALTTLGYGEAILLENPGSQHDGTITRNGSSTYVGKLYGAFSLNLNIGGRSLPPEEIALITELVNQWKNARSELLSITFTDNALHDGQINRDGTWDYGGQPI